MRVPENADRDFTAGCIVLNDRDEVLLVNHSKLGMWLQPGGHIEEREVPSETALRETREETGWKVEVFDEFVPETSYQDAAEDVPTPFRMNLHRIEEGHFHLASLFLASPVEKVEATGADEHDGARWFAESELDGLEMPENLRSAVSEALKIGERTR